MVAKLGVEIDNLTKREREKKQQQKATRDRYCGHSVRDYHNGTRFAMGGGGGVVAAYRPIQKLWLLKHWL